MEINPQTSQIISTVFAFIGLLATATPSLFPSYIPSDTVKEVIQTAGFVTFLWNGMQTALHGFSSSQPGAWAPKDPPAVVAAQATYNAQVAQSVADKALQAIPKVFLGFVVLCLMLGPVVAKDRAPLPSIPTILQPLVDFVTSDFAAANVIAAQAGDGNLVACFNAAAPLATLIKTHPLPVTLHVASDFAAVRALQITLKNLCESSSCTQVFNEEANQVAAFGLGLPMVSLQSACAKISPIAIVPVPAQVMK